MDIDVRWASFAIWGIGTVIVYGADFIGELHRWHLHRDDRARRDVTTAFALLLTALSSGASIWVVLFGTVGTGIRPLFVAVSLGSFFGAGIVKVTMRRKRDPAEVNGDQGNGT